ncbi:hypothetical protein HDV05_006642 [Chytridiales sp. JEL 0842]|nr:hypothetical protein HDV05_006642 [Chytridiales sp. JEL 0842]
MTTQLIKDPLVWIDLEMTGLDLSTDHIIEIACIITDGSLNTIATGPDLIIHQPKQVMDAMSEWCVTHHGSSGLTASVLASKLSVQEAEKQVLEFIKQHIPEKGVGVLAGNSVHMDKEFIRKEMPALLDWLHYRLVDVSTVKELARRWDKNVFTGAPKKGMSHRALDDIKESIEELRYYRRTFFKQ